MEVGIDITSINRFEKLSNRAIKSILTEVEYSIYNELPSNEKIVYLAKQWAFKEAIFKATNDNDYLKYSILYNDNPYVLNMPNMKLSYSIENDKVITVVIVE